MEMINVEDLSREDDLLKNSARRMLRKNSIGPIAMPSVLTVVVMLLLTNTVLLFKEKNSFVGKGQIQSAPQTSDSNWKSRNSSMLFPLCSHVNEFLLSEDVYVKICVEERNIHVQIGRYNEQNATIEGIQLNQIQWINLKKSVAHIDSLIIKNKILKT
jgi:hypothetical protein